MVALMSDSKNHLLYGDKLLQSHQMCISSPSKGILMANCAHSFRGPSFTERTPNKIVFHNSSGAIAMPCNRRSPTTVQWTKSDWTRLPNIPGLRHSGRMDHWSSNPSELKNTDKIYMVLCIDV
ncbi:down syndrome cell adhesion molecule-like protein Dscam2 [Caerostris extrusa]|uniref:Down syndrome cell adhesion molecule-like protein Dscam2 n=1 Tax=Caerostris extrusa TaxID=172846 RepID=A0AAV4VFZ9_CAEEX|nr:down syndrome cell adhesion molecule-like protein Dscam2 [Caerostris extrusa]